MAKLNLQKKEELKKMSAKDRSSLLIETEKVLAVKLLHVRTREDKKSDEIRKLKTQKARILTFNNQVQDEK